MITWVSERSGTASSRVLNRAEIPSPNTINTPITVKTRWRPQASINRSITIASPLLSRRTKLAFGGHEEVARGHHDLPCSHTTADLVVATGTHAELHFARLEP